MPNLAPLAHIGLWALMGRVRLSMVLPSTNTSAARTQAAPGEGKCQISVNVKVIAVLLAWTGFISHLVGLAGLSVSGDPKAFLWYLLVYIILYTSLNLTRFQQETETDGYIFVI